MSKVRVQCLSCGSKDTVDDPSDCSPQGVWECDNCGWGVGKPLL